MPRGGSRGGVSGVATPPPNGQRYNVKCSTTDVLSHGDALIYIATSLFVAYSGQVVIKLQNHSPDGLWCSMHACMLQLLLC